MGISRKKAKGKSISLENSGEVQALYEWCQIGKWDMVLSKVRKSPWIALTEIKMPNNLCTRLLHQVLNGKGDAKQRWLVVSRILRKTPEAASLTNGHGSYPLHAVLQRNTRLKAVHRNKIIRKLVKACPEALLHPGGSGRRTPLHVIFTDYLRADLTKLILKSAPQACRMTDKKGMLPAHIACSRHCSAEKLRMLLAYYPDALKVTVPATDTHPAQTMWSLACSTATETHPNVQLKLELKAHLETHNLWEEHMEKDIWTIDPGKETISTPATTAYPQSQSDRNLRRSQRVSLSSVGSGHRRDCSIDSSSSSSINSNISDGSSQASAEDAAYLLHFAVTNISPFQAYHGQTAAV